ncbi:cell death-inducing p53-target protein 1 homolog [Glandiceps talaboti]
MLMTTKMEAKPPPYPGEEDAPPPYPGDTPYTLQSSCWPPTPPPKYPGIGKPLMLQPWQGPHTHQPVSHIQRESSRRVLQSPQVADTRFYDRPVRTICSACQTDIETRIEFEVGAMSVFVCILLFMFGIWPCCLIPLFTDSSKDVIHACPNCNKQLGSYRRW